MVSSRSNASCHASLRVDETRSPSCKRPTKEKTRRGAKRFSERRFCATDARGLQASVRICAARVSRAGNGEVFGGSHGGMRKGKRKKKKRRNGEMSHFLSPPPKKKVSVFTFSRRGNDRMGLPRVHRLFSHFSLRLAIAASSAANQHTRTHTHTHRAHRGSHTEQPSLLLSSAQYKYFRKVKPRRFSLQ